MKIELTSATPQFLNDLGDVVRLFYGAESAVYAPAEEACEGKLTHTHAVEDGQYVESCVLTLGDETFSQEQRLPVPLNGDALEEKRVLKRAIKLCAYALLRTCSGVRPPWGALTGVRPTRLMYAMLDKGFDIEQAAREMQAVYDVSEEKAALLGEIIREQDGLLVRNAGVADIYVGIPFCTTRCSYCSFSSGELGDGRAVEPYLSALFAEIRAARVLMDEAGLSLRALYVGGGTPTSLNEAQLARLMEAINASFPHAQEFTVEAGRPDTLNRAKLHTLKAAGVTRISVNPQTMNDQTLARIGRAHSAKDVLDAFFMAREAGFDDINMDVICGLPGEDAADFARTLDALTPLSPESLTVHTLAIKHSSKLHEALATGKIAAQDDAHVRRMVDMGLTAAHAMGMRAYYLYRQKYMAGSHENVGYAKLGHACRYNIDIMEETTSILALGAGAISKRVDPDAQKRIERAPNVSNIEQYTARVQEMIARKRAIFLGEKA